MKEYIVPLYDTETDWDEMFVGAIRQQEELVRCKDCKYNNGGRCSWHGGAGYKWIVDDDDFCSCGERKDEYVTLHHEDINFINDDAERAFYESLAERTRSFTDEEWEFYKKVNREKTQKTGLNIYDLMNKKEEEE